MHGGALAVARSGVATTFAGRGRQSVAGKRAVGRAAAALLTPGAVTILDGGSTAVAVAEAIAPGYTGTIVTHSVPAAAALAVHEGVEVVLVGGTLERRAMVAVGADCINTYRSIRADMVLLGVWALHAEHGLSEGYREEAEVRRVLLGCGDRVVGLATADKLGTVAPFGFGPADALTHLVTERERRRRGARPAARAGRAGGALAVAHALGRAHARVAPLARSAPPRRRSSLAAPAAVLVPNAIPRASPPSAVSRTVITRTGAITTASANEPRVAVGERRLDRQVQRGDQVAELVGHAGVEAADLVRATAPRGARG